jgi:hypothetical protein
MKKLLVTLTVAMVAVGAFGQGKLSFQVDSTQLIYLTTDTTKLLPTDATNRAAGFKIAGSTLYTGAGGTVASLAGAPSFTVGLFGGATAGALTLQASTTLADVNLAGQLAALNVAFATLPAGTAAFFQIEVYDSRATSTANAWTHNGWYAGQSPVFSAVPSAGAYSPIYQTSAPVNSTLPVGTFVPLDYAAFPGYKGLIEVSAVVPEPGTFALAGLGLATLLALRRRS